MRRKSDIDDSAATQFATLGHVTVDALAYANFMDSLRLNFGVFNLFDRKYWNGPMSVVVQPTIL